MASVLLFTAQDIGFQLISRLSKRHDLCVVSYRSPRDEIYGYRSAKDANPRNYIETDNPEHGHMEKLRAFNPEILVCANYSRVLSEAVISLVPLAINCHPGILPYYKGKFPTPWYILNRDREFGIAIHQIVSKVDAGPVYVQRIYPMPDSITGHELYRLTMDLGAELIDETLDAILDGKLKPTPQAPGGSTYNSIDKLYRIDWTKSASEIEAQIRVHAKPYIPAWSPLITSMVFINKAKAVDGTTREAPGTITEVSSDSFTVACGKNQIRVLDYELAPAQKRQDLLIKCGQRFD